MNKNTAQIRDALLAQALPSVPFDGWTESGLENAAVAAGYNPAMARAVFPGGVGDALDHFAGRADRWMMDRLADTDPAALRVRDRIRAAVLARLESLKPHREAERRALAWWSVPTRIPRGTRILWRTADRIWDWAGDTATDYNRYTKRGLLAGVIASTTLAWLDDNSSGMTATAAFLDRRIEAVLKIGGTLGKLRKTG